MAESEEVLRLRAQVAAQAEEINALETQFLEESYRQDEARAAEAKLAQDRIAGLEKELTGARDGSTIARLRADLAKTLESESKKHELVGKRNDEIAALKKQVADLEKAKTDLESRQKARDDRVGERTREIRDLNQAVQRKGEEIAAKQSEITALTQRVADFDKLFEELEPQRQAQAKEVETLKASKADLLKLANQAVDGLQAAERDLAQCKEELAASRERLTGLEKEFATLSAARTDLEAKLAAKTAEQAEQARALVQKEAACTALGSDLALLQAEVENLKQQLAQARQALHEKNQRITELEQELVDRPQALRDAAGSLLLQLEGITSKIQSSLGVVKAAPLLLDPPVSGAVTLGFDSQTVQAYQQRLEACLERANEALSILGDQLAPLPAEQKSAQDRFDSASRQNDVRKELFERELGALKQRIGQLSTLKGRLQELRAAMRENQRTLERYTQLRERLAGLSFEEGAVGEVLGTSLPEAQVQQILANLLATEEVTTLQSAGIGQSGIRLTQALHVHDGLQKIAMEQGLSLQGAIIILLCEILPKPNRAGIRMKSLPQLLAGADKSGIAQRVGFSTDPADFGNGLNGASDFRGTPDEIAVFQRYGHYYPLQHTVSRKTEILPWSGQIADLLPEDMVKTFSSLLEEQAKPPRKKQASG